MIAARLRHRLATVLATAGLLALAGAAAAPRAQSATAASVKAGFLYHFAKFTEWPAGALAPGAPLTFCVIDEPNVTRELAKAAAGRHVDGRELVVTRMELDGPIRSCHVLYAERLDARSAAALVTSLEGAPVLSVADFPGFTQLGGVSHLFLERGRMRFAINVDAAGEAGLRLSSRLLSLAVIVKEGADGSGP